ncbi:MAG: aminoglycoside phosphotransferase family protein [Clostridia bacterium]|nr:aminoglycoside phosphotransferase family protein [Clostridia bacterium]
MENLLDEAKRIIPLFDVPFTECSIRHHGNGHINDTFLLTPENGASVILQRVSPVAFHHPEYVMSNMLHVTETLRNVIRSRGGNPDREALSIIPLKTGESYAIAEDGSAWRMTRFIDHAVSKDLPDTPDLLAESGHAFGRFQRDLSDFPAETLYETIPHFHDTPARLEAFREAIRKDVCGRCAEAKELIDLYLERAERADELTSQLAGGELPLRVTHNDTKLNNVLLDEKTLHALCVVDLDTVMPGLSAYDFGDSIRFGASTALEDERDPQKIHFSLPMFRAFAEGYLAETRDLFSPAEVDSLATGAWVLTYECGMRFLTDYLSGDVYFHIACEDHNLVRAWNQMYLLQDMERYRDEMLECVRSIANQSTVGGKNQ